MNKFLTLSSRLMKICLFFILVLLSSDITVGQDAYNYDIKFETRNAYGWFGGDNSEWSGPRNVGNGQSVLINSSITINKFSFYFNQAFDYDQNPNGHGHQVNLVLNIRNTSGTILRTVQTTIPDSFNGGWGTWSDINMDVDSNTTLIFTCYLVGAYDTAQFTSSIASDAGAGYPYGTRYTKAGTGDSSLRDWNGWYTNSWDANFWLQGTRQPITILSPNGGDSLQSESTISITYKLNSAIIPKIEYSTSNGFYWAAVETTDTIGRRDPGVHSYSWKIPSGINSSYCLVKISDASATSTLDIQSDPPASDVSDNPFTIFLGELVPKTPTNLHVTSFSINSINLEWTDNSNTESIFKIYRRRSDEMISQYIGYVAANFNNFTDGYNLEPLTIYYYYITALNFLGESPRSNIVSVSIGGSPLAPSRLSCTPISATEIKVIWNDNSDNESGFYLQKKTSNSDWEHVTTLPQNTISYTNQYLLSGIKYFYRVRTVNEYGESEYSNTDSATLGGQPYAPRRLQAVPISRRGVIQLSWMHPAYIDGNFEIEARRCGDCYKKPTPPDYAIKEPCPWIKIGTVTGNSSFSHTTFNEALPLTAGQCYMYRVAAVYYGDELYYSNIVTANAGNRPPAPSNLAYSVLSNTRVRLDWGYGANDIIGFNVYRQKAGQQFELLKVLDQNLRTWEDQALTVSSEYLYEIKAYSYWGESDGSNRVRVNTTEGTHSAEITVIGPWYFGTFLPISEAKIYVDRDGNGFINQEPGETNTEGKLIVTNLRHGDRIRAWSERHAEPPSKSDGHEGLSKWKLIMDNGEIQADGYYKYPTIGNQTSMVITLKRPIYFFDVFVSLEWDASEHYIDLVEQCFNRASSFLYDATDGQAIFGTVRIATNKQDWTDADVKIHDAYDENPYVNGSPGGINKSQKGWYGWNIHLFRTIWKGDPYSHIYDIDYAAALVHEWGHYAFGVYDEYEDGNGNEKFPYKEKHPEEFPNYYGLMDASIMGKSYHDDDNDFLDEFSSSNDYLKKDDYRNKDKKKMTAQYWEHKKSCWSYINSSFGLSYARMKKPASGYLSKGSIGNPGTPTGGQDRPGPSWIFSRELPANVKYPKFVVDKQPKIFSSQIIDAQVTNVRVPESKIFIESQGSLSKKSSLNSNEIINLEAVPANSKVKVFGRDKWMMHYEEYSLNNTPKKMEIAFNKSLSTSTRLTSSPGFIMESRIERSTSEINVTLLLEVDQVLEDVPSIQYYFSSDSGTCNLTQISIKRFVGNFLLNIDTSLNINFEPKGYIHTQISDTAENIHNYITTVEFVYASSTERNKFHINDLRLVIDDEQVSRDQFVVFTTTFGIPYKSYSQSLIPVGDMYFFHLDVDNIFEDSIAINLRYGDSLGLDERSFKIYRWNPDVSFWEVLTSSNVDVQQNLVTALANTTGTYAIFATASNTDFIAPRKINDLVATPGKEHGEIILTWSASGDDDSLGKASYYEIRWLSQPINETNWDSASSSPNHPPKQFSEFEELPLTFEDLSKEYYFAIKAYDEANNSSLISNTAFAFPGSNYFNVIPITLEFIHDTSYVYIGRNNKATEEFDGEFDNVVTVPDSGCYGYLLSGDSLLMQDIRSSQKDSITWNLHITRTIPIFDTAHITWDQSSFMREENYFINGISVYDTNQLTIVGDAIVLITSVLDNQINVNTNVSRGWNMISLPITSKNQRRNAHFSNSISEAWTFENGYRSEDTLRNGAGYWLKFDSSQSLQQVGLPVISQRIKVQSGWNMIGSVFNPMLYSDVLTEPEGIVTSPLFRFSNGYNVADTLKPFEGFWLKANDSGEVILSPNTFVFGRLQSVPNLSQLTDFHKLIIKDAKGNNQTLYFDEDSKKKMVCDDYELPPLPPAGVFDVRFMMNKLAVVLQKNVCERAPILISGAQYPITLSWELTLSSTTIQLQSGKETILLKQRKSVTISDPQVNFYLELGNSSGLPQTFTLEQNYPNPFNPMTEIHYALPVDANVVITVYNILGQMIQKLVDESQRAGYKSVEWNADALPSGVYFYRIDATGLNNPNIHYNASKKAILLK